MVWTDYWGALTARQRSGLIGGGVLIVVSTIALAWWLLRDPYVPLTEGVSGEQLRELTQQLDVAKMAYRIDVATDTVEVPRSVLSDARALTAGGQVGVPASVGLELFKETDFSTTDFAQRINYQRALQGELARTLQTIAGVRAARVHVILADPGVFKRDAAKASAAVSLTLQPGAAFGAAQVRGIQRLVAASVPAIKADDVVVLDETGASLTRPVSTADGELSTAQLDLKRQADQYLEGKLTRLLQELAPHGSIALSVDAVLDERRLQVTTNEPLGVRGAQSTDHASGVLVKERHAQRGNTSGFLTTGTESADPQSMEREYEYQVGSRVEQALSAPGSIKRVSVAVALHGAPAELTNEIVEQLVASAVGIDRTRGDSVTVLLTPVAIETPKAAAVQVTATPLAKVDRTLVRQQSLPVGPEILMLLFAFVAVLLLAMIGMICWRHVAQRREEARGDDADVEALAEKVRTWLNQGEGHGRA